MQKECEAFEQFCKTTTAIDLATADYPLNQPVPAHVLAHTGRWISGHVKQIAPAAPTLVLETDEAIRSGTSGGPVVTTDGLLLGLVSWSREGSGSGAIPRPHLTWRGRWSGAGADRRRSSPISRIRPADRHFKFVLRDIGDADGGHLPTLGHAGSFGGTPLRNAPSPARRAVGVGLLQQSAMPGVAAGGAAAVHYPLGPTPRATVAACRSCLHHD
jgi:hypothetical protein